MVNNLIVTSGIDHAVRAFQRDLRLALALPALYIVAAAVAALALSTLALGGFPALFWLLFASATLSLAIGVSFSFNLRRAASVQMEEERRLQAVPGDHSEVLKELSSRLKRIRHERAVFGVWMHCHLTAAVLVVVASIHSSTILHVWVALLAAAVFVSIPYVADYYKTRHEDDVALYGKWSRLIAMGAYDAGAMARMELAQVFKRSFKVYVDTVKVGLTMGISVMMLLLLQSDRLGSPHLEYTVSAWLFIAAISPTVAKRVLRRSTSRPKIREW